MADRAFSKFMKQTLEPARALSENERQIERMRNAHSIDDYTDNDLLWLLRCAMLKEGVKPLGKADNIHAQLVERASRREETAGERVPLHPEICIRQAIIALGAVLGPLERVHRDVIGAGLKYLIEHPDESESFADTASRLVGMWRRTPGGRNG